MNKRGDTTVWHELIKAIPAMLIVLLLFWAGVKIWNVLHPEQFTTEKKDLIRLTAEIKDLRYSNTASDSVTVPIFSRGYVVEIAKNDFSIYPGCNLDYCLCLSKDGKPLVCEAFNIRDDGFFANNNRCPNKDGKDYKGINIISNEPSTNYPVIIKRAGICDVQISGTKDTSTQTASQATSNPYGTSSGASSDVSSYQTA